MSLIVQGNTFLGAFSNVIRQNYYMSTYYALTGQEVAVQYRNPINLNFNQNFYLSGYYTNFGDTRNVVFSLPDVPVTHRYNAEGTYFVSYSAVYVTGNIQNPLQINRYQTDTPFNIKASWATYNPQDVRLNDEIVLKLPYTFDEIAIQPNEWGDEDIFNTSIYRLQECLDYLISKTQTINTFSPTLFYGWLGNNTGTKASTIKWFTQSINFEFLNNPEIAKTTGQLFFKNVIDSAEVTTANFGSVIYVLDGKDIKIFRNGPVPALVPFTNGDQLSAFLVDPVSFSVSESGDTLYVVDKIANSVYKLLFTPDLQRGITANLQLFVGGFGGLKDTDNFNTPTHIYYKNENVYVLDYNNYCIKQYNKDLNWLYTYFIEDFENDRPISTAVLKNGLIYVLTENYNIYIFDQNSNNLFETFSVKREDDESKLLGIEFDENESFLQVLTEKNIHKYTLAGGFVTSFIIPKNDTITYTNIKAGKNCTFLISSQRCIFKVHDVLQVFRLGDGLPYLYWDRKQLTIDKNELVTDIVYNRSLLRMAQNILTFKNSLNARFIIAAENVRSNVITYFSYLPVNVSTEVPTVENIVGNMKIGINELHVPAVFNRELRKLYNALNTLSDFLSIKNYNVQTDDCLKSFCWSWDATSCYDLKLPVIKTCSINPISYQELLINQSNALTYAPDTTWEKAKSKCCEDRDPTG